MLFVSRFLFFYLRLTIETEISTLSLKMIKHPQALQGVSNVSASTLKTCILLICQIALRAARVYLCLLPFLLLFLSFSSLLSSSVFVCLFVCLFFSDMHQLKTAKLSYLRVQASISRSSGYLAVKEISKLLNKSIRWVVNWSAREEFEDQARQEGQQS